MKKVPNRRYKHSVDQLMLNTASALIRDFRSSLSDPCYCSDFLAAIREGNIAKVRQAAPTPDYNGCVAEFKATYQLQSVFKRYRFENDTYSDDELKALAIESFENTQRRLANVDLDALPLQSRRVLDLAANYIARVLGKYSDEEHRNLCRFGRRASVGIPLSKANEAQRWELPISGSREQISWFDAEMRDVDHVQEYWIRQLDSDPQRAIYQETDSLKLTLVPKTFKSLRSIMPNTTIGSYMSYGLGEMIRKRLRREGYDIRTLQMRHRVLANRASLHNLHVTADLSSASDSITVALVKRLLPPDWFEILERSRIGKVELPDGRVVHTETYCTMGIGYTFPLQTLVFLSLLQAIQRTLYGPKDRLTISVYGDDLIYATRMHNEVVDFLQQFGFVINIDKTFHEGGFRESCGGDYYHGVDVRPFQPRNGAAHVGDKTYEAMLYKYVNGLLARWSEYEIGETLRYLLSEIEGLVHKIKIVPIDFPDDAGVKCVYPKLPDFLVAAQIAKPKHVGSGVFRFSYLRLVPEQRKETRHEPYYWGALRDGNSRLYSYDRSCYQEPPCSLAVLIETAVGVVEDTRPLRTVEDSPVKLIRGITGQRLRRTSTFTTISGTGRYARRSGRSCFEHRRQ